MGTKAMNADPLIANSTATDAVRILRAACPLWHSLSLVGLAIPLRGVASSLCDARRVAQRRTAFSMELAREACTLPSLSQYTENRLRLNVTGTFRRKPHRNRERDGAPVPSTVSTSPLVTPLSCSDE